MADESDAAEIAAITPFLRDRRARMPVRLERVPDETTYAAKINRGIAVTETAYVFSGADDLHFHEGWYETAEAYMSRRVGLVGTNDLCNPRVIAGEHATHFLVARWYAERGGVDGPLFPEVYRHWYTDNELIEVARARKAYAHCGDSHVQHLHPLNETAPMDDTYRIGFRFAERDRQMFESRKPLWA